MSQRAFLALVAALLATAVSGAAYAQLDVPDPVNSQVRLQVGPANWLAEPTLLQRGDSRT